MSDNATQTVNKLRRDFFGIVSGTIFHAGADTPIATANATDLPSLLTLVNALVASFNAHVANVVDPTSGVGIHGVNSGDAVSTGAGAIDLGTAAAALGALNRAFRSHAGNPLAHFHPDRLPAFSFLPTDPTLVPAMCAWANAMTIALNAHYAAALNSEVAA